MFGSVKERRCSICKMIMLSAPFKLVSRYGWNLEIRVSWCDRCDRVPPDSSAEVTQEIKPGG